MSLGYTSNVTSGNYLLVIANGWNIGATVTPTDNLGTSFFAVHPFWDAGCGSSGFNFFFLGKAPSGGADTVTIASGLNVNNSQIVVEEWSGVADAALFGRMCVNASSTYTVTNNMELLTSQGGVVVLSAVNTQRNTTFSWSGGTIRQQNPFGAGDAGMVGDASISQVTTLLGYSTNVTVGTSGNGVVVMLFLSPAASAPAKVNSSYPR